MPESHLWLVNHLGGAFTLGTFHRKFKQLENTWDGAVSVKRLSASHWCAWAIGHDHRVYIYVRSSDVPIRVSETTFENQRWWPIHKFSKKGIIKTDRPAWSNEAGTVYRPKESVRLPSAHWDWEGDWLIDENLRGEVVGIEGWQYAFDFPAEYTPEKHWNSCVRKRKWIRFRRFSSTDLWARVNTSVFEYSCNSVSIDAGNLELTVAFFRIINVNVSQQTGKKKYSIAFKLLFLKSYSISDMEVVERSECFIDVSVGGFLMPSQPAGFLSVWAVTNNGHVYVRTNVNHDNPEGSTWQELKITGHTGIINISVGASNLVWAVTWDGNTLVRTDVTRNNIYGSDWVMVEHPDNSTRFMQVSVGRNSVWAISREGKVWFRKGTSGDDMFWNHSSAIGTRWVEMVGEMSQIAVSSNDQVFAIDLAGKNICFRTGVTAVDFTGKTWQPISLHEDLTPLQKEGLLSEGEVCSCGDPDFPCALHAETRPRLSSTTTTCSSLSVATCVEDNCDKFMSPLQPFPIHITEQFDSAPLWKNTQFMTSQTNISSISPADLQINDTFPSLDAGYSSCPVLPTDFECTVNESEQTALDQTADMQESFNSRTITQSVSQMSALSQHLSDEEEMHFSQHTTTTVLSSSTTIELSPSTTVLSSSTTVLSSSTTELSSNTTTELSSSTTPANSQMTGSLHEGTFPTAETSKDSIPEPLSASVDRLSDTSIAVDNSTENPHAVTEHTFSANLYGSVEKMDSENGVIAACESKCNIDDIQIQMTPLIPFTNVTVDNVRVLKSESSAVSVETIPTNQCLSKSNDFCGSDEPTSTSQVGDHSETNILRETFSSVELTFAHSHSKNHTSSTSDDVFPINSSPGIDNSDSQPHTFTTSDDVFPINNSPVINNKTHMSTTSDDVFPINSRQGIDNSDSKPHTSTTSDDVLPINSSPVINNYDNKTHMSTTSDDVFPINNSPVINNYDNKTHLSTTSDDVFPINSSTGVTKSAEVNTESIIQHSNKNQLNTGNSRFSSEENNSSPDIDPSNISIHENKSHPFELPSNHTNNKGHGTQKKKLKERRPKIVDPTCDDPNDNSVVFKTFKTRRKRREKPANTGANVEKADTASISSDTSHTLTDVTEPDTTSEDISISESPENETNMDFVDGSNKYPDYQDYSGYQSLSTDASSFLSFQNISSLSGDYFNSAGFTTDSVLTMLVNSETIASLLIQPQELMKGVPEVDIAEHKRDRLKPTSGTSGNDGPKSESRRNSQKSVVGGSGRNSPKPVVHAGSGRNSPKPVVHAGSGRNSPKPVVHAGSGRNSPKPVVHAGSGRNSPKPVVHAGSGRNSPKPVVHAGSGRNSPKPVVHAGSGRNSPKPVVHAGSGRNSPKPVVHAGSGRNSPKSVVGGNDRNSPKFVVGGNDRNSPKSVVGESGRNSPKPVVHAGSGRNSPKSGVSVLNDRNSPKSVLHAHNGRNSPSSVVYAGSVRNSPKHDIRAHNGRNSPKSDVGRGGRSSPKPVVAGSSSDSPNAVAAEGNINNSKPLGASDNMHLPGKPVKNLNRSELIPQGETSVVSLKLSSQQETARSDSDEPVIHYGSREGKLLGGSEQIISNEDNFSVDLPQPNCKTEKICGPGSQHREELYIPAVDTVAENVVQNQSSSGDNTVEASTVAQVSGLVEKCEGTDNSIMSKQQLKKIEEFFNNTCTSIDSTSNSEEVIDFVTDLLVSDDETLDKKDALDEDEAHHGFKGSSEDDEIGDLWHCQPVFNSMGSLKSNFQSQASVNSSRSRASSWSNVTRTSNEESDHPDIENNLQATTPSSYYSMQSLSSDSQPKSLPLGTLTPAKKVSRYLKSPSVSYVPAGNIIPIVALTMAQPRLSWKWLDATSCVIDDPSSVEWLSNISKDSDSKKKVVKIAKQLREDIMRKLQDRNKREVHKFKDIQQAVKRTTWVKKASMQVYLYGKKSHWVACNVELEQGISNLSEGCITVHFQHRGKQKNTQITLSEISCVKTSSDTDNPSGFVVYTPVTNIIHQPLTLKASSENEAADWIGCLVAANAGAWNMNSPEAPGAIWSCTFIGDVFVSSAPSTTKQPSELCWGQHGGHTRLIETGPSGVTWSLGFDRMPYVYNGGYGGAVNNGTSDMSDKTNQIVDHHKVFVYENQTWFPVVGWCCKGVFHNDFHWLTESGRSVESKEEVKLPSSKCQWVSDWTVDFRTAGGVDTNGWQYSTSLYGPFVPRQHLRSSYRRRRWFRQYKITVFGPWNAAGSLSLVDLSVQIDPVASNSDPVVLWAVGANGDVLCRNGVSADNPKGQSWIHVATYLDKPFKSISVGGHYRVWGIAGDGSTWFRPGVSPYSQAGTCWLQVVPPPPGSFLLHQVSAGATSVWAVDTGDNLWRRENITPTFPEGTGWEFVAGRVKRVSVGPRDQVWIIADASFSKMKHGAGVIYSRVGITSDRPAGTDWEVVIGSGWAHVSVRGVCEVKQKDSQPGLEDESSI